jgi:dTMP kinase
MGKLIILEGMDGSGTTTQIKLLENYLSGLGYLVTSSAEPTNSAIGQEIRKWLKAPIEHEPDLLTMLALCFAADRMQHVHFVIKPALKTYDFVLVDRYVMSSLVYQGLHVPEEFVEKINQFALKPDLVLLLDVSAEMAFERITRRQGPKDFYESVALLQKMRERYKTCAENFMSPVAIIDSSPSAQQVHENIRAALAQLF